MIARLFALGTLLVLAASGCSSSNGSPTSPVPGGGHTVQATPALAFTPASITVHAGDAVSFAFGSVAHNVYFDAAAGAPDNIAGQNANATIDRTFNTPGTYHYTCHIHPSMSGDVIVQ